MCVCVLVCPLCKPPWKAPLLKSHVGLQTLQSCCLIVYSAISGSPVTPVCKKTERVCAEVYSLTGRFRKVECFGCVFVFCLFFSQCCTPEFRKGIKYLFYSREVEIHVFLSTAAYCSSNIDSYSKIMILFFFFKVSIMKHF